MGNIWLYSVGWSDHAVRDLRQGLSSAGVTTRAWSGSGDETPGLLLFSEVTPSLLETLHAASFSGRCPVLAIAASDALPPLGTSQLWKLLNAGAADVIVAGRDGDTTKHVAARLSRWSEIEAALERPDVRRQCVGSGHLWRSVLRSAAEATLRGTAPILVSGESGTGKEVVAHLIHELDSRPEKQRLIIVDCTTIVRELSGSELFGHVKGAFTGAHSDRDGAFALAHDGTLFLDEVGELPPVLQAELLRVVQTGTFKAVGSNVWHHARFRLVAATHRDLAGEVAAGRFRADLYHRLTGWQIGLPALRQRAEDIGELARAFVREFAGDEPAPELSVEVLDFLMAHPFPGNVRQLRHLVMRAMQRYPGAGPLTLGLIAPEDRPGPQAAEGLGWLRDLESAAERAVAHGVPLKEINRQVGDCVIRHAVRSEAGSLQRAAKRLGVTDRALQLRMASQRLRHSDDAKAESASRERCDAE